MIIRICRRYPLVSQQFSNPPLPAEHPAIAHTHHQPPTPYASQRIPHHEYESLVPYNEVRCSTRVSLGVKPVRVDWGGEGLWVSDSISLIHYPRPVYWILLCDSFMSSTQLIFRLLTLGRHLQYTSCCPKPVTWRMLPRAKAPICQRRPIGHLGGGNISGWNQSVASN